MFADQSRDALRAAYREAWRKWRERVPLQPLEAQIADVVAQHPEYHALLQTDAGAAEDSSADAGRENPFLHLGLHLALRDQLATDRPQGIAAVHARLASRPGSRHALEHRMIEVLAAVLWEAQRSGRAPDDAIYLERLQRL
ncbi:MAG TPA: DUF1841 family protein [Steroidobacteraceae bacterium]